MDLHCFEQVDDLDDLSSVDEGSDDDVQDMCDDVGGDLLAVVQSLETSSARQYLYPDDHFQMLLQKEKAIPDAVKNKHHLNFLERHCTASEFFLAANYMDRYHAAKKHIYGLPLVCYWLAEKMDNKSSYFGRDVLMKFRRQYPHISLQELLDAELDVVKTLDYEFMPPTIFEFVHWGLHFVNAHESRLVQCAQTNARLCVYSSQFSGCRPSLVAAGCVANALDVGLDVGLGVGLGEGSVGQPKKRDILTAAFRITREELDTTQQHIQQLVCYPCGP